MTSGRPYGARVSVPEALAELRRCSGSQFDPRVVPAFWELVEKPDPMVLQVAKSRPGLAAPAPATRVIPAHRSNKAGRFAGIFGDFATLAYPVCVAVPAL